MLSLFKNTPIEWLNYSGQLHIEDEDVHVIKIHRKIYYHVKNHLTNTLNKQELEKKNRFLRDEDAERFALGKYFTRQILSQILKVPAGNINFLLTATNKPYLKEINFNISHSGDYIVIAVSRREIGVDVELIKNDFDHDDLAKACFNPNERRAILKIEDFYIFWTRKEAILKATGEGIIDDLPQIDCVKSIVTRKGKCYNLKSYLMDERHVLSLAHEKSSKIPYFWKIESF